MAYIRGGWVEEKANKFQSTLVDIHSEEDRETREPIAGRSGAATRSTADDVAEKMSDSRKS